MRQQRITPAAGSASMSGVAIVAMLVRYHPTSHTTRTSGSLIVGVIVLVLVFAFAWMRRRRS